MCWGSITIYVVFINQFYNCVCEAFITFHPVVLVANIFFLQLGVWWLVKLANYTVLYRACIAFTVALPYLLKMFLILFHDIFKYNLIFLTLSYNPLLEILIWKLNN